MFAADLYEVLMQGGKRPLYENPENFFALTFPTHNLRNLVRDVALRLAGKNDKAVRQLELTYGGGKTHTLITLRHLVHDPDNLPDMPAVHEFTQAIGQTPPKCRVAGLCFDKLDVEKGMDVRDPNGNVRLLKHPWSVLAYQVAGDEGLKLPARRRAGRRAGDRACRKHADAASGTAGQAGAGRPGAAGRSADVRQGEGRPGPILA